VARVDATGVRLGHHVGAQRAQQATLQLGQVVVAREVAGVAPVGAHEGHLQPLRQGVEGRREERLEAGQQLFPAGPGRRHPQRQRRGARDVRPRQHVAVLRFERERQAVAGLGAQVDGQDLGAALHQRERLVRGVARQHTPLFGAVRAGDDQGHLHHAHVVRGRIADAGGEIQREVCTVLGSRQAGHRLGVGLHAQRAGAAVGSPLGALRRLDGDLHGPGAVGHELRRVPEAWAGWVYRGREARLATRQAKRCPAGLRVEPHPIRDRGAMRHLQGVGTGM
jgi:hypothetical protein